MTAETKPESAAIRVLVVNDHQVARYTTARMLRAAGFAVTEAGDGQGALAAAATEKPDVMILDVRLPDIDGYEVCKRLRANEETASLAIIHTSATFVSVDKKVRGLEIGADAYLTQPYEPEELVAVVRALARLRRAEQELRERAERLQEADRRKDEFLAMLAHELRNPLAAITMSLPLLQRFAPHDELETRALAVMDRQTMHLRRLIDDLLDVSRVTRGQIDLKRAPLVLQEILDRSLADARKTAFDPRRQALNIQVTGEPLRVEGDADRLEQVFSNLLDNASKYSEPGAKVTVSLDSIEEDGRSWARVRVTDEGVGIDRADLPHIFELFSQAEQSIARSRGGLGIGLTLVQRLVELHDGQVMARSEGLGRGTEFEVRLPRTAPRAADGRAGVLVAARAHPVRRMVIVEDNPDSVEVLVDLCALWGHQVEAARDGAEGLRLILETQPEIALVDIGLPKLDGYQVAAKVRADPRGRDIFLIALTGYGSPEERERAFAAGFDVHMTKPVNALELREHLSGQRPAHQARASAASSR